MIGILFGQPAAVCFCWIFFVVKRRNGGMDDDVMKSNNENESFRSFLISFLFAGLFFNFVNISFFFGAFVVHGSSYVSWHR